MFPWDSFLHLCNLYMTCCYCMKHVIYVYFQSDINISFLRAARSGDIEKVIDGLTRQGVDINCSNAVSKISNLYVNFLCLNCLLYTING